METKKLTFQAVLQWTEEQCREFLASMRWPNGVRCPKCGVENPYTINRKSATKNQVKSLYKCRSCRRQFTATIGTIFEDSKIPLNKWLAALFLMCSSKKGISSHQLFRLLDLGSYRTAWFMSHRIREAMREKNLLPLSGTIEADETYIYPKWRRGHKVERERIRDEAEMGLRPMPEKKGPYEGKTIVFGMLERDGNVRTVKVEKATAKVLHPIIAKWIDKLNARVITDGHPAYRLLRKYLVHDVIDHEVEYVRGDVHTQGIDGYWSLIKRGIYGVFHHVDEGFLPQYLQEFDFRFNHRKVSDAERFSSLMGQTQGRLLWYCQTPQILNPYA